MDSSPESAHSDSPFDELNEKCAVFGIYNHSEAGNLTYLGLYALQHRGQEGCGIATMDNGRMIIRKGEGLVSEFFRESVISELKGRSAIGHNRYSTAGSDSQRISSRFPPTSATPRWPSSTTEI
ncbi:MAG: Amidophosphoribosyltransferase [Leptospirillum sp. Group IV 'UBA BS']|nr:MAG: Amidophosphoribosyltransferase [Leptospirillum sp. Group IV 'UBA BS']